MNLFGEDMIIGNFKLSDYGLVLASFEDSSNTEDDLGMNHDTIEEYIGENPVPVYIGAKYSEKLRPTATIIKNPCIMQDLYFTEHECRTILRELTGFYGYKKMQIYSNEMNEMLYFNVRINSVQYKKVAGKITGIIFEMECDSQFAWSKEFNYTYKVSVGTILSFYNISDDLNNYLKPTVKITAFSNIEQLEIVNLTDNNWTTVLKNISANEVIIMDSKNEILESSLDRLVLNDFNMHFIRFVSGINKIQVNSDVMLNISFVYPRKVGFV